MAYIAGEKVEDNAGQTLHAYVGRDRRAPYQKVFIKHSHASQTKHVMSELELQMHKLWREHHASSRVPT